MSQCEVDQLTVMTNGQSQNDYIRDYIPKRSHYLDILLDAEAQNADGRCLGCDNHDATWRCNECFGRPSYCSSCCKQTHARHPFHRVESWTGSFFQPSWLRHVGVCIHLGHGGGLCPTVLREDSHLPNLQSAAMSDNHEANDNRSLHDGYHEFLLLDPYPRTGDLDVNGKLIMVIVDVSGIHHIGVQFCHCSDATPHDSQLMSLGLFPATFDNPQTAFTFRVLDDFLLDNLER